jgi:hypothetical protein
LLGAEPRAAAAPAAAIADDEMPMLAQVLQRGLCAR